MNSCVQNTNDNKCSDSNDNINDDYNYNNSNDVSGFLFIYI